MSENYSRIRLILLVLLALLVIVTRYESILSFFGFESTEKQRNITKLEETLEVVDKYYVDDVEWKTLIEGSINGLLKNLDPHSVYFTSTEAELNEENFQGKYQGIGIHFDVLDGYITVISVIPGSPSEKVGLRAGDKIIKIDGKSAYDITTADVPKKLKGPSGSEVLITVQREGLEEPFDVPIIRDEIPIYTIYTYFMVDEEIGYIWVNRFANTTENELEHALIELEKSGMKKLLLDLRDNGGGFLQQAVKMVGKFISGHHKVVYTRGRLTQFDQDYYTDEFGKSINRDYPLVILINEGSASASEIVAGAIQDYDRGLIAGQTSFGKGLVQNEFVLNDESRLRLTISKYYTPSGRLIQRPYKGVEPEEYYYHQPDSLNTHVSDDTTSWPVYYTQKGRPVYGGGGINPDVEIPFKSGPVSGSMINQFWSKRIFFEAATAYAQKHPELKKDFNRFLKSFRVTDSLIELVRKTALSRNLNFTNEEFKADRDFIANRIKAEIARSLWGMNQYYQIILQYDNQFHEALKLFPKAEEIMNLKQAA